jgi:methyltransferase
VIGIAIVAVAIVGMMLAELRLSRANERRLRAAGAIRPPGDPYLALAVLYPAAFLLMSAEGLWRARAGSIAGAGAAPWFVAGAIIFAASKTLKYWAVRSLGSRWSFGVWVLPGSSLVRTGPYRYAAHPNYIAVVGELVGAAMMMRAHIFGPIAIAAFGLALAARIRFETRVLATIARTGSGAPASEERG